jgi:hypothetical protein
MKKENNKGLIIIIIILVICVLGLVGYIIFDKYNKKELEEEKVSTTTIKLNANEKSIETCSKNKALIAKEIETINQQSFIKKYYPEDYVPINTSNIICDYSSLFNNDKIIIHVEFELNNIHHTEEFIYNLSTKKASPYDDMTTTETTADSLFKMEAFNYAKEIVSSDIELFENNHPSLLFVSNYKDYKYDNGDEYILQICDGSSEGDKCENRIHYYDYKINFKTKTFEKINIDVK